MKVAIAVILTSILTFPILLSLGQTRHLIIQNGIALPKDSVIKAQLINSLNQFLSQKDKANQDNTFVLKDEFLATSDLLDEMKGIEKSIKLKDDNFYKGYLTNVIKLNEHTFEIQVAYIGIDDNAPVLRASYTLLAKKQEDQFRFYSPLKRNASSLNIRQLGNTVYHFKDTLNVAAIKRYQKVVEQFDKRLNAPKASAAVYYFDSSAEALKALGIDYKKDYNGRNTISLSSHEDGQDLEVNGSVVAERYQYDPHDLWHARVRGVLSSEIINRPVDEGCAYFYGGGSWGYSWEFVLLKFKEYAAQNPNADWLTLYLEGKNYFAEGDKYFKIPYALNALIIQKLEKEKGFTAVRELLSCGKKEKDDENYFKALEKITGINKSNFNIEMWKLIKGS